MTLAGLTLSDRKKLVVGFPLLLAGVSGTGKSTAISNMRTEDKKRTLILNFDNKPASDSDDEFWGVIHPFNKASKQSYLLDDPDFIAKFVTHILAAGAKDDVDRIIVDTYSHFKLFVDEWKQKHYSGYDIANAYTQATTSLINSLKEVVITHGKFCYVFAHYPAVDRTKDAAINKRFVTTKGTTHKSVEEYFSTVVESTLENRKFRFRADSFEESDTTKCRLPVGMFDFPRNSLHELELVITKTVPVSEDGSVTF